MSGQPAPSWPAADLAHLFDQYFGDRLTPTQLDALAIDVAAALADRRTAPSPHIQPPHLPEQAVLSEAAPLQPAPATQARGDRADEPLR